MPLDSLFLAVNSLARSTPWLHGPAAAYAVYGLVAFVPLLAIGWWRAGRAGALAMAGVALVALAALVAYGVQQAVVLLVAEPRPYAVHPDALVLVGTTIDPSFPSDHACLAGALTAGLFLVDRRLGGAGAALAVLLAADRVYVGAHWPLDVVAGLALGAAVAFAFVVVARRPAARLVARLEGTPLRPLVAAGAPA